MVVASVAYLLALAVIVGQLTGLASQGSGEIKGARLMVPLYVMIVSGVVLAVGRL